MPTPTYAFVNTCIAGQWKIQQDSQPCTWRMSKGPTHFQIKVTSPGIKWNHHWNLNITESGIQYISIFVKIIIYILQVSWCLYPYMVNRDIWNQTRHWAKKTWFQITLIKMECWTPETIVIIIQTLQLFIILENNVMNTATMTVNKLKFTSEVNQVKFCLGKTGLIQFIKYLGLTQILHWIACSNNGI